MRSEINDLDTANKFTQMANIEDDKSCLHGQALHFSNKQKSIEVIFYKARQHSVEAAN